MSGKKLSTKALVLAPLALGAALVIILGYFHEIDRRERGFQNRVFESSDGRKYKYVFFIPHNYTRWKSFPLILYLHGYGKRGEDGHRHIDDGLATSIRKLEHSFDFIAVFPQGRSGVWKPDSEDTQLAMNILADIERKYSVDSERIYLTGISSGAEGTWNLAARYPNRWAAIVPVVGRADPELMEKVKHIPCWCFHAVNDLVTPVEKMRELIRTLKAVGGSPKYTEYIGIEANNHNVWDQAYDLQDLYYWLLQQSNR